MIGAVGFGGMFAVYSYIAPILTDSRGLVDRARSRWRWPSFGVGMTLGTIAGRPAGGLVRPAGAAARFHGDAG